MQCENGVMGDQNTLSSFCPHLSDQPSLPTSSHIASCAEFSLPSRGGRTLGQVPLGLVLLPPCNKLLGQGCPQIPSVPH